MSQPNWQFFNVVICLITSSLALYLGLYALRQKKVQGAGWFCAMTFAVAWITLWYAFESAAGDDLDAYLTFSKIEYIGLTFVPMAWFGFAVAFSGNASFLSRKFVFLLALVPLITTALAWTNDWHGLIWAEAHFEKVAQPPIFSATYGAWFWIYIIYSYVVYLIGSIMLLRLAFRSWRLYRIQSLLILIATSIPWLGNISEIVDFAPLPGFYLNAVYFAISVTSFAFALFRLRLLEIMPLAHDLILNNIPDGVVVTDKLDQIVMVNDAILRFLGLTEKEVIGQPLVRVFSDFSEDVIAMRGVVNQTIERRINDMVVQTRIAPLYDQRGALRGRLFVTSDITAHVAMEQARREQQIFAETLREIGTVLNSTLDLDQVLALLVQSVGRVVQHDWADVMLIGDDGYTAYTQQYVAAVAGVPPIMSFDYRQFPVWLEAADSGPVIVPYTQHYEGWQQVDTLFPIRSYASAPIRLEGQLVGFINLASQTAGAFKQDIAVRLQIYADQAAVAIQNARLYKQVKQQTEELNRRVEALTIVQRVYDDIGFSFNTDSLIETAMDAAMRLSMADGGYVALMQDGMLYPARYFGKYQPDALAELLAEQAGVIGQAIVAERNIIRTIENAPAETGIVSALPETQAQMALPLYASEANADAHLFGIMVLETKRAERFQADRFQLLGLLADRLALAIENARLVEAVQAHASQLEGLYAQVSRLEQIKTDMIRIAAHDLKNPLSVLLGYLELLLTQSNIDVPMANYRKLHEAMKRAVDRMYQIIMEILSLQRIEEMAQQTGQQFDVHQTMHNAAEEYAERAAAKHQRFIIQSDVEGACWVNGDDAQIREAMSNLISNAIKYTPDDGAITISLQQQDGWARFEVRDTGYGIPQEMQAGLFQAFYRVQSNQTAAIEGTGLGLHLVKNIIERHGGKIIFNSVYGEGSTFGFELPIAGALEPVVLPVTQPAAQPVVQLFPDE